MHKVWELAEKAWKTALRAQQIASALQSTLSTPNFVQAAGNSGTGGAAVTVTTAAITKTKSGQMSASGNVTGTSSAATTVTAQLVRDAATNIGPPMVATTLSAGDGFSIPIDYIDTAPDGLPHTYKLVTTATAGTLTVALTSAQLSVSES